MYLAKTVDCALLIRPTSYCPGSGQAALAFSGDAVSIARM
jgi:hypothetical protein